MDEGLVDALAELRDKFKCNVISGCPAHDVVRRYGWRASPYLQSMYGNSKPTDPWRARIVTIVALLQDPEATPMLMQALDDPMDAVKAAAVMGLAKLDRSELTERLQRLTRAGLGLQRAQARLAAWWALERFGVPGAARGFHDELAVRSGQFLASRAIVWGLQLCHLEGSRAIDCHDLLHRAARHPAFIVRREVLDILHDHLRATDGPTIAALANDPIGSIARRAKLLSDRFSGLAAQSAQSVDGAQPAQRQGEAPRPAAAAR